MGRAVLLWSPCARLEGDPWRAMAQLLHPPTARTANLPCHALFTPLIYNAQPYTHTWRTARSCMATDGRGCSPPSLPSHTSHLEAGPCCPPPLSWKSSGVLQSHTPPFAALGPAQQ